MKYIGEELFLFQKAVRWKWYWSRIIKPYMHGDVLEVGAGIGANTRLFLDTDFQRWVCLEPDPELLREARARVPSSRRHEFVAGTISDIKEKFDVVFYIDVLEHIKDDSHEMQRAAEHLKPGGTLIVLVPAHQWLYSPFDKAVGHVRRYTKRTLRDTAPPSLRLEKLIYLDSVGLLASIGNKLFLRQTMPTLAQIRAWDVLFVPISKQIDPLLGHRVGKSVLGIWSAP
ncbi:hypothetical protein A3A39_03035 [Candidatus Kaiserbacteria bacterium RIFCSPLOWO2_01_FULL_54_13]|uniref:Methyltransferase type 12 domain-containing protein n=1 Tax=Candidatus Kaiserbacteria bacterium RIFCSPLOWO2_01_FULL_54_13 TaxID=1798512 RepID=A0A1F6F2F9_9BACT|nr:MAG: hypothetical protein A3A39_03035 [Candidatus Kaiserbacteria bacterium RIFCSPLOWO2_01_FULL_54_13]